MIILVTKVKRLSSKCGSSDPSTCAQRRASERTGESVEVGVRAGHFQHISLVFKRGLDLNSGTKRGSPRPRPDSDGRVGRMWLLIATC